MKKKLLLILVLLLILTGLFSYRVKIKNFWLSLNKEKIPPAIEYQQFNIKNQEPITQNQQNATSSIQTQTSNFPASPVGRNTNISNEFPTSYNLDVPFTPQAPFANWDETFKEACEEAVSLIVHYYYENKTFTPQLATAEILNMVNWQQQNWGGHFDLTASRTAQLIKGFLGYNKVEVIDNPTIENIKWQISQGRPVIVPAAGRELHNPYFRQPGPIYHMLVIKGYTEEKFITNDPGTKRGHDYLYDYEVIMNAIHDWNEVNILQGLKTMIVIYPN